MVAKFTHNLFRDLGLIFYIIGKPGHIVQTIVGVIVNNSTYISLRPLFFACQRYTLISNMTYF